MSANPMTMAVAGKALDGLYMRMAAISENIANANTPRFKPLSVNFEDSLRNAAARGVAAVDGLQFEFRAGRPYAQGEDRRLDLAIADASQTATRYSALVEMMGERLSLSSAVAGAQG